MLSSDFSNLAAEAERMVSSGADYLHMDVMDGHFVPNLTIGAPVIKSLRKNTDVFLDCHLMVSHPEQWIKDFAQAGASMFTFHIEATEDPLACIHKIRETGMKVGIALKPSTSVEAVFPYTKIVDMVLIMTVEPGFGGQSFMESCASKVTKVREQSPWIDIQVDGGISEENIEIVAKAGANIIVAGTSIFSATSPANTIKLFKDTVQKYTK